MTLRKVPEAAFPALVTCHDKQGMTLANLIVCEKCEGRQWLVFVAEGMDHLHMQCYLCQETYCSTCHKPNRQRTLFPDGTAIDASNTKKPSSSRKGG